MPKPLRSVLALATTALALGACSYLGTDPEDDEAQIVTTSISVSGVVVTEETGEPIPNATVRLGSGGITGTASIHQTTPADPNGTFRLVTLIGYRQGECGYWIGGRAPGYADSDPASNVESIECVASPQTVEVRLTALEP